MIFVTVGTHHQPMTRLMNELERIADSVSQRIWVQYGPVASPPKGCEGASYLGYDEMNEMMKVADVVITHGGPGSIMLALRHGKKPVVVPRQHQFGEHVDDHQVHFTRRLEKADKVIAVYDIASLREGIEAARRVARRGDQTSTLDTLPMPADTFADRLDQLCRFLVDGDR